MKFLKYLGCIAIIIGIAVVPFFSYAQDRGVGLSISPLKFEISSNPGEQHTSIVKVTNQSGVTSTVRMSVQDFAPVGEAGQVSLVKGEVDYTYSLAQWVTVTPIEFLLDPGQTQNVEFRINVPENAEPGGHYGSILASLSGGATGGGASIAQKVGSLTLLHVAGDVKEELAIKSMEAVKPDPNNQNEFIEASFFEYGPVKIRTRFENTGTVHLKPLGFVHVKDIFGREVAKLDMPQQNVLPDSVRRIDVDFGGKWMFGGKYTATFTGIYGSSNEPITYSTSFWIIPWKVGGAVLAGLLLVLGFFWKARKRFKTAFKVLFKGA